MIDSYWPRTIVRKNQLCEYAFIFKYFFMLKDFICINQNGPRNIFEKLVVEFKIVDSNVNLQDVKPAGFKDVYLTRIFKGRL